MLPHMPRTPLLIPQEGLAHVCLVGSTCTLTRAKIEVTIPRKRGAAAAGYDKAIEGFYDKVFQVRCPLCAVLGRDMLHSLPVWHLSSAAMGPAYHLPLPPPAACFPSSPPPLYPALRHPLSRRRRCCPHLRRQCCGTWTGTWCAALSSQALALPRSSSRSTWKQVGGHFF